MRNKDKLNAVASAEVQQLWKTGSFFQVPQALFKLVVLNVKTPDLTDGNGLVRKCEDAEIIQSITAWNLKAAQK